MIIVYCKYCDRQVNRVAWWNTKSGVFKCARCCRQEREHRGLQTPGVKAVCVHCGRKYCKCWKSTTPSSSIHAAAAQPPNGNRDTFFPKDLSTAVFSLQLQTGAEKGNRRLSHGLKSVRPGRARVSRDRDGGVK